MTGAGGEDGSGQAQGKDWRVNWLESPAPLRKGVVPVKGGTGDVPLNPRLGL